MANHRNSFYRSSLHRSISPGGYVRRPRSAIVQLISRVRETHQRNRSPWFPCSAWEPNAGPSRSAFDAERRAIASPCRAWERVAGVARQLPNRHSRAGGNPANRRIVPPRRENTVDLVGRRGPAAAGPTLQQLQRSRTVATLAEPVATLARAWATSATCDVFHRLATVATPVKPVQKQSLVPNPLRSTGGQLPVSSKSGRNDRWAMIDLPASQYLPRLPMNAPNADNARCERRRD